MTKDIVDSIADNLLEDHISLMNECKSLRDQLAAMTKERDKAKAMPMKYRRMEFNAQLQNENESLRQQIAASEGLRADMQKQLAAALAACKLKDEALDKITQWDSHSIAFAVDYGSSGVQDRYRQVAREALAIHPDDSALKAWLGEPVAWETREMLYPPITKEQRRTMDIPLYRAARRLEC